MARNRRHNVSTSKEREVTGALRRPRAARERARQWRSPMRRKPSADIHWPRLGLHPRSWGKFQPQWREIVGYSRAARLRWKPGLGIWFFARLIQAVPEELCCAEELQI